MSYYKTGASGARHRNKLNPLLMPSLAGSCDPYELRGVLSLNQTYWPNSEWIPFYEDEKCRPINWILHARNEIDGISSSDAPDLSWMQDKTSQSGTSSRRALPKQHRWLADSPVLSRTPWQSPSSATRLTVCWSKMPADFWVVRLHRARSSFHSEVDRSCD